MQLLTAWFYKTVGTPFNNRTRPSPIAFWCVGTRSSTLTLKPVHYSDIFTSLPFLITTISDYPLIIIPLACWWNSHHLMFIKASLFCPERFGEYCFIFILTKEKDNKIVILYKAVCKSFLTCTIFVSHMTYVYYLYQTFHFIPYHRETYSGIQTTNVWNKLMKQ